MCVVILPTGTKSIPSQILKCSSETGANCTEISLESFRKIRNIVKCPKSKPLNRKLRLGNNGIKIPGEKFSARIWDGLFELASIPEKPQRMSFARMESPRCVGFPRSSTIGSQQLHVQFAFSASLEYLGLSDWKTNNNMLETNNSFKRMKHFGNFLRYSIKIHLEAFLVLYKCN